MSPLKYTSTVEQFESDLSSLIDGTRMFWAGIGQGGSMVSFKTSNLDNLKIGEEMFRASYVCTFPSSEVAWNMKLPSLENGAYMFQWYQNDTFVSDMPKLTNGYYMFFHTNHYLKNFICVLPSL